ncbi:hypothetical protein COLO4_17195 [Corchorus olitorius]|uniref:Uncharacterized protein n=1 Tax=Corchorus olitorius TaxID=93759 RepID=A0A1R3JDM0_9ROSI|nr:hypothetical protein COLO4_17195 [Corchorus olitorius]
MILLRLAEGSGNRDRRKRIDTIRIWLFNSPFSEEKTDNNLACMDSGVTTVTLIPLSAIRFDSFMRGPTRPCAGYVSYRYKKYQPLQYPPTEVPCKGGHSHSRVPHGTDPHRDQALFEESRVLFDRIRPLVIGRSQDALNQLSKMGSVSARSVSVILLAGANMPELLGQPIQLHRAFTCSVLPSCPPARVGKARRCGATEEEAALEVERRRVVVRRIAEHVLHPSGETIGRPPGGKLPSIFRYTSLDRKPVGGGGGGGGVCTWDVDLGDGS